jgi:glutamyl-tRNA synthetase
MTITRFAPSPTGYLHIGGLRTALFSWLMARKNGGKFLLRIEDTDLSRNSQEALDAIIQAFEWVGLDYDDEAIYQSQRFAIYQQYIDQLLESGKAYRCYTTKEELEHLREEQTARKERPRYDGRYRDFTGTPPEGIDPVIRIKAPQSGEIILHDGIKGEIRIAANEVDDFILARSDGTPTYNFVVAVDDALMGLTDVIRGDDHLYNTPKQIVVYEALGLKAPRFYHVAMIHNEQGKKLSKRDGATDVMTYKDEGFLPEALLNFLVRLGWSHGDQEIFTLDEMVRLFDPRSIGKSASAYNLDKLLWLNAHYLKNTPNTMLAQMLVAYGLQITGHDRLEILMDATKERAKTLVELAEQVRLILERPTNYNAKSAKKLFKEESGVLLDAFDKMLQSQERALHLPVDYHAVIEQFVTDHQIGFGKIAQPLRLALLGAMTGPGLDEVMAIIGVEQTLLRIRQACTYIAQQKES